MKKQFDDLWQYCQSVVTDEMDKTEPSDFTTNDTKKVTKPIASTYVALAGRPVYKKLRRN